MISSKQKNPAGRDIRRHALAAALIAVCGILAFAGTVRSPFHYDDIHAIAQNPYIKDLTRFQEEVGAGNIFNRSILLLTFAVNRYMGGLETFGYHLTNILIHVWAAVLLYFVARELLELEAVGARRASLPLLASVLFLLHPMTTEPVAYLSSRSALLATFFYLFSFYCFARFVNLAEADRQASWRRAYLLVFALGFFFLGVGSKETVATLPVMAAIYAGYRLPPARGVKDRLNWALALLPLLVYLALRTVKFGNPFHMPATQQPDSVDTALYFFTQIKVMVFYYLLKWALPVNLNFEPDARAAVGWADAQGLAACAVLLLAGLGTFRQKSRLAKFGMIWVLVTVLPESSFIPLKQIAAERRVYLPGLGISLALGVWILNLARSFRAARAAALCLVVMMSLLAIQRGLVYRTEIRLWEDAAKKSPRKILVHNNLASVYIDKKQYDRAQKELESILRMDPAYTYAHANLGNIYFLRERWDEAREEYDQAVFYGGANHANLYSAGLTRIKLKNPQEAIPYLERAIALKPEIAEYHFALGNAYRELRQYDNALTEYRLALKYKPDYFHAHNNIAVIFWNLRSFRLAEAEFKQALALDENNAEVLVNLAAVSMALNEYQNAIDGLNRVLALQPGNDYAKKLLAAVHSARAGQAPRNDHFDN